MGVDGREEPYGSEESSAAASHRAPPGVPGQGGPRSRGRGRHGGGPSLPQQRGSEWGGAFDDAVSRTPGDAPEGPEAESPDADGAGARSGADRADGPGDEPDERESPPSDAELVARLRDGEDPGADSYALLYRRHADAVRGYARSCCRDVHTAEDLTNEVFASTLQAVRRGSGPDTAVRAYLLTTVRRVAAAWAKTARREQLVEDFAVFAVSAAGPAGEDGDTPDGEAHAMRQAEASLAVQAFRSLPERWQMVLWHTTVEEEAPSQVAPLLGLSANATAVLAHRAREGLRQAYLQAHVSASLTSTGSCAQYADRLGAYARGGLRMRAERGLRKHLAECARCRTAALELADVNARLRAVLPVAVVGWFTAGASAKAVAGLAAGAAGAGAGAAAGGAAASGAGSGSGAAAGEGLGAPAKVALGAGAVLTAGAVLAYALSGGSAGPPRRPEARRPVASAAPSHRPGPTPTAGPTAAPSSPPPPPEPRRVAARAVVPSASSTPAPTPPATPSPAPSPSHTPRPAPPSRPVPSPPPPKPPKPVPPPPAAVHHLNELDFDALGDRGSGGISGIAGIGRDSGDRADREPEVRIDEGSPMWQRDGLRVGGHTYLHGVSVGTTSSVAIDLNGPCTAYDALAGVDDLSLGGGAVRFSVSADGERLWESEVLRSGDAAVPVHVPLDGRRTLRLEVEGMSPYGDVALADWALARLVCT
ncbi:sigma-70 family RNA polymerase sigma factor [Streptomyces luteireticuli]|uniref:Glycosyl hydrolase family 98 putative carbohydrate-binding module domain-containing protein n=1 Tax=Streptomyces luteireticuli TaxID=173858 RepID=A0ABP3J0E1_9ACTN